MRRERPKLFNCFRPTLQQLAFFLISNYRRGELGSTLLASLYEVNSQKQKTDPLIENGSTTNPEEDSLRKRDMKGKSKPIL